MNDREVWADEDHVLPANPAAGVVEQFDVDPGVVHSRVGQRLFPSPEWLQFVNALQQLRMISPDGGEIERLPVSMHFPDCFNNLSLGKRHGARKWRPAVPSSTKTQFFHRKAAKGAKGK
jgi:hypothetical protein